MPKTNTDIVRECNELAILFYEQIGCEVDENYKMYQSTHPQEALMWRLACVAFLRLEYIDVQEIVDIA